MVIAGCFLGSNSLILGMMCIVLRLMLLRARLVSILLAPVLDSTGSIVILPSLIHSARLFLNFFSLTEMSTWVEASLLPYREASPLKV